MFGIFVMTEIDELASMTTMEPTVSLEIFEKV
jgi:hypothetical protein